MDSVAKVLYDPVGYYRPWRKAAGRLTPSKRSALNHYLLGHYALPDYSEPTGTQALLAHRIVNHWDVLPLAAYLVACAKWRSQFVSSRAYLRESPVVHAFLQMGFHEVPAIPAPGVDAVEAWVAHGGRYINQGLLAMLPDWLSARLSLIFMSSHQEHRPIDVALDESFDATCFWSALTYASSHRELSDSLCG